MLGNKAVEQMLSKDVPQCLLVIPQTEEFATVRQLISSSLVEVGIEPIETVEILLPDGSTADSIYKARQLADVIIADLTGGNPNVMYEVGFAHAMRKPVLPIVQRQYGHVPTVISDMGELYIVYDPTDPDKFRKDIQYWTRRYLERKRSRAAWA